MSQRSIKALRAGFEAQCPYPENDPRRSLLWRKVKAAYAKLPKTDRSPDKLGVALIRAIKESI